MYSHISLLMISLLVSLSDSARADRCWDTAHRAALRSAESKLSQLKITRSGPLCEFSPGFAPSASREERCASAADFGKSGLALYSGGLRYSIAVIDDTVANADRNAFHIFSVYLNPTDCSVERIVLDRGNFN